MLLNSKSSTHKYIVLLNVGIDAIKGKKGSYYRHKLFFITSKITIISKFVQKKHLVSLGFEKNNGGHRTKEVIF